MIISTSGFGSGILSLESIIEEEEDRELQEILNSNVFPFDHPRWKLPDPPTIEDLLSEELSISTESFGSFILNIFEKVWDWIVNIFKFIVNKIIVFTKWISNKIINILGFKNTELELIIHNLTPEEIIELEPKAKALWKLLNEEIDGIIPIEKIRETVNILPSILKFVIDKCFDEYVNIVGNDTKNIFKTNVTNINYYYIDYINSNPKIQLPKFFKESLLKGDAIFPGKVKLLDILNIYFLKTPLKEESFNGEDILPTVNIFLNELDLKVKHRKEDYENILKLARQDRDLYIKIFKSRINDYYRLNSQIDISETDLGNIFIQQVNIIIYILTKIISINSDNENTLIFKISNFCETNFKKYKEYQSDHTFNRDKSNTSAIDWLIHKKPFCTIDGYKIYVINNDIKNYYKLSNKSIKDIKNIMNYSDRNMSAYAVTIFDSVIKFILISNKIKTELYEKSDRFDIIETIIHHEIAHFVLNHSRTDIIKNAKVESTKSGPGHYKLNKYRDLKQEIAADEYAAKKTSKELVIEMLNILIRDHNTSELQARLTHMQKYTQI